MKIELGFHVKAIDMLTAAFNGLLVIDTRSDMVAFRKAFDFSSPETAPEQKNSGAQSTLRRFSSTPEISGGQQQGQAKKGKDRAYESEDDLSAGNTEISTKPKAAIRKS